MMSSHIDHKPRIVSYRIVSYRIVADFANIESLSKELFLKLHCGKTWNSHCKETCKKPKKNRCYSFFLMFYSKTKLPQYNLILNLYFYLWGLSNVVSTIVLLVFDGLSLSRCWLLEDSTLNVLEAELYVQHRNIVLLNLKVLCHLTNPLCFMFV